jgi:hypothetical protein
VGAQWILHFSEQAARCKAPGIRYSRAYQTLSRGHKVSADGPPEERILWRERYQAQHFDFRGKIVFARFDCCEFVKCTLLIDRGTGQLAFTECVFKDCNIDKLETDQERGLYTRDNFFDRPLAERRADFENRLAQSLAARMVRQMTDTASRISSQHGHSA